MSRDGLAGCPEPIYSILSIVGTDVYVGPKDAITVDAIATDDELKALLKWCTENIKDWNQAGSAPIAWNEEKDLKKEHIYRYENGSLYVDKEDRVWVLEDRGCGYSLNVLGRLYAHPKLLFIGESLVVPAAKASDTEKKLINSILLSNKEFEKRPPGQNAP
jgi:hypothetical protein